MTADEIFSHHTAESLRELEETMPPDVHVVGYDDRGWVILDALWSGPGVKTISMEVNHKPLKLVLESSVPLRVYVNPMLGEADEWEKPPWSGNFLSERQNENMIGVPTTHGQPLGKNRRQRRSEEQGRHKK